MNNNELLSNNSLSNIIAEKMIEQIMTGELKPGDKIVETMYAEEYGTSRAPIREALYLLTTEGLVERVPRKGSVVKGYTTSDMYDLLQIRMMLENLAIERIAKNGVDASLIEDMRALIPSMEKVEGEKRYAELNHKFHSLIIKMTKSEVIMNMYSRLGLPLLTLQTMSFVEERYMSKSLQEHRDILAKLEVEQINQAKKILNQHNQDMIVRVENQVNEKRKQN